MRIYAVADIHGKADRIERVRSNVSRLKPDVLVVAGDITNYTDSLSIIEDLNDMPVPVLAVRGNSDLPKVEALFEHASNIASLHMNKREIQGVTFVGVSGTIPMPFYSRICCAEGRVIKRIEALLEDSSVLVAHPPPRGILDEAFGRFHAGSAGLYKMIVRCQPRLFICGHIHERPGWKYVEKTLVVNCNMGRGRGGALVTYDEGGTMNVEMLP